MIKELLVQLRISLVSVLSLAVLLCGVYTFLVWVAGQALFPREADGSLIRAGANVVGSSLISQGFSGPAYFHPRPSAAGAGHDASSSGGSNLGPTSKKLIETVRGNVAAYRTENNLASGVQIPADAVTASASGLDPHISIPNALLQARRVATARGLAEEAVRTRIAAHTEGRTLGILGEPRVNVLMLNLDLDGRW